MLTREQILKAQELKSTVINVPEWGGEITLRQMTSLERFAFFEALDKVNEGKERREQDLNASGLFVIWTTVDKTGKRLFADKDLSVLVSTNAAVIERVAAESGKLNGITSAEEAAGN